MAESSGGRGQRKNRQIKERIVFDKSHGYTTMRRTNLKEMHIVRYADDFRIFCPTKDCAERTLIAVTQWLKERLRLDVSPEKDAGGQSQ